MSAATLAKVFVRYTKMQGAGNRILVIDARDEAPEPPDREMLCVLADETTGPGFDQVMWLTPAMRPGSAASYRVFNSDGTEVEQCGNGIRCVARLLADEARDRLLAFDSPAGRVEARLLDDGRVSVDMGAPIFDPADVPFIADDTADAYALGVAGQTLSVAVLSMGNPHCVLEVADVATAPVATLGPAIEHHKRFPQRVNAGFRHIRSRDEVDLRVFERGAGETMACGTGACAAVVSGIAQGLLDEAVRVNLPGGELMVSWRGAGEPVWLTGNADFVDEGSLDL